MGNKELNDELKRNHSIVKFDWSREGWDAAHKYLVDLDRMKDFWFHCSTFDMVNHANKIYNESIKEGEVK